MPDLGIAWRELLLTGLWHNWFIRATALVALYLGNAAMRESVSNKAGFFPRIDWLSSLT
jgi:hypothetical protein